MNSYIKKLKIVLPIFAVGLFVSAGSVLAVGISVGYPNPVNLGSGDNLYYGNAAISPNPAASLLLLEVNSNPKFRVDPDGSIIIDGNIVCTAAGCTASTGGDNLGNHLATQNLNMGNKQINSLDRIYFRRNTGIAGNNTIQTDNSNSDLVVYSQRDLWLVMDEQPDAAYGDLIVTRNGPGPTSPPLFVVKNNVETPGNAGVGIGVRDPNSPITSAGGVMQGTTLSVRNTSGKARLNAVAQGDAVVVLTSSNAPTNGKIFNIRTGSDGMTNMGASNDVYNGTHSLLQFNNLTGDTTFGGDSKFNQNIAVGGYSVDSNISLTAPSVFSDKIILGLGNTDSVSSIGSGDISLSGGSNVIKLGNTQTNQVTFSILDGNGRFNIYNNAIDDGDNPPVYIRNTSVGNDPANRMQMNTDGITFYTAPTGNAGAVVPWTERLKIQESGVRISGELSMVNSKITNLATPTLSTDAANKSYVDNAIVDAGGGDNLGNHIATQALQLNNNSVYGIRFLDGNSFTQIRLDKDNNETTGADFGINNGANINIFKVYEESGDVYARGNLSVGGNLDMTNGEIDNVNYIDIGAVTGNGIRFWSNNLYSISMGNTAEYKYGSVTDYSIKNTMSNTASRGWTWGVDGQVPVASINTQGNMKLAGTLDMAGSKVINLAGPTASSDAATKGYVDSAISGASSGDNLGNHTATTNINVGDWDLQNVHALKLKDWDDNTGGTDNKYRLLARDGAWMFHDGGLVVGSYSDGTWADLADGSLIVKGNTGLGTTNPSQRLDVNGNIKTNGNLLTSNIFGAAGIANETIQISDAGDTVNIGSGTGNGKLNIIDSSTGMVNVQIQNTYTGGSESRAQICLSKEGGFCIAKRGNSGNESWGGQDGVLFWSDGPADYVFTNNDTDTMMRLSDGGHLSVAGTLTTNGLVNVNDNDIVNVRELELKDYDTNGGGADNTYRLLARDNAWMFHNGGVIIGSYADGGSGFGALAEGNLVVKNNAWVRGNIITNQILSNDYDNVYISDSLRIASAGYIDDDATMGGDIDDWIRLNGYVELKSTTDNYGIVLRDKDNTEYLGITQKDGASYLSDSNTSDNYFLKGSGRDVAIGRNAVVEGDLDVKGSLGIDKRYKVCTGNGQVICTCDTVGGYDYELLYGGAHCQSSFDRMIVNTPYAPNPLRAWTGRCEFGAGDEPVEVRIVCGRTSDQIAGY